MWWLAIESKCKMQKSQQCPLSNFLYCQSEMILYDSGRTKMELLFLVPILFKPRVGWDLTVFPFNSSLPAFSYSLFNCSYWVLNLLWANVLTPPFLLPATSTPASSNRFDSVSNNLCVTWKAVGWNAALMRKLWVRNEPGGGGVGNVRDHTCKLPHSMAVSSCCERTKGHKKRGWAIRA